MTALALLLGLLWCAVALGALGVLGCAASPDPAWTARCWLASHRALALTAAMIGLRLLARLCGAHRQVPYYDDEPRYREAEVRLDRLDMAGATPDDLRAAGLWHVAYPGMVDDLGLDPDGIPWKARRGGRQDTEGER